jgi:hypothetical protein
MTAVCTAATYSNLSALENRASATLVYPYRDVGRFQGQVHRTGQVTADRVQVHSLLQPRRKCGYHLVCVIPGSVEPPVYPELDPPSQRVEQRRGGQCGSGHGGRGMEPEHFGRQQHQPRVHPISRPVTMA